MEGSFIGMKRVKRRRHLSLLHNMVYSLVSMIEFSIITGKDKFVLTHIRPINYAKNVIEFDLTKCLACVCWLCPTKALWEHLLNGYRGGKIKSWLNG